MRADKSDFTPDEKIRFFDTVLNLNILNKVDADDVVYARVQELTKLAAAPP